MTAGGVLDSGILPPRKAQILMKNEFETKMTKRFSSAEPSPMAAYTERKYPGIRLLPPPGGALMYESRVGLPLISGYYRRNGPNIWNLEPNIQN